MLVILPGCMMIKRSRELPQLSKEVLKKRELQQSEDET